MQAAADILDAHLAILELKTPQKRVISTISGQEIGADVNLREQIRQQMTQAVCFTDAVAVVAADTDLFIEAGPGHILSRLTQQMTDVPCVSVDAARNSLRALLSARAAAYVAGVDIDTQALFKRRFSRPFNLDWQPRFFVNPCELAPNEGDAPQLMPVVTVKSVVETPTTTRETASDGSILAQLRDLVAESADLPLEAIADHHQLLSDLHLNSITVGKIVTDIGRSLGLHTVADPTAYANASLKDIANAMEQRLAAGETGVDNRRHLPVGVAAWIRAFAVQQKQHPLSIRTLEPKGQGGWQVFGHSDLKETLTYSLNT